MTAFYFSTDLGRDRKLCLAPITDRQVAASTTEIDDVGGYFLFEQRGCGEAMEIEVIARATSEQAATRLREMLGME